MARPSLQSQTIEHGHEWQRLRPLTDPIEPRRVKMIIAEARAGDLGRLHRLYDRMEATDDRYGGVVSSLKRSISSRTTRISPSKKHRTEEEKATAQKYAEWAKMLIGDLSMQSVLKTFSRPYLRGVDIYEIMYERRDAPVEGVSRWYEVTGVQPAPARRVQMMQGHYGPYGKLGILNLDGTIDPVEDFDDRKVFSLVDEPARGRWDEVGVARRCLMWWIVKQFVVRWWPQFAETWGEPMRLARTSQKNLPSDEESKIVQILENLGANGWGIIPDDVQIEVKDNALGKGGDDVYAKIKEAADMAYTIAVLGQTDTTETSEGAYAKAKIQNEVRLNILQDVADLAAGGVEHVIRSALAVNETGQFKPHLAPSFEVRIPDPTGLPKKANAYNTVQKKMGVAIPARQVRDEFSIKTPSPDEPVIADGRLFENEQEYLDYMEKKAEAGPPSPPGGGDNSGDNSGDNPSPPASPAEEDSDGDDEETGEEDGDSSS